LARSIDNVRRRAALVIALARIPFRVLVREHRALRLEHCLRDDVLRRDQLDLRLLTFEFGGNPREHGGVGIGQTAGEKAIRLDVVEFAGLSAHAGTFNLSTRS
jgi:hypothetical protein